MDHKPLIPIEAPLPATPAYKGPLVLPKPGAFAVAARASAALAPAPAAPAAARGPEAPAAVNRFAGARPVEEWPQAWML